jgi:hypothetical protein
MREDFSKKGIPEKHFTFLMRKGILLPGFFLLIIGFALISGCTSPGPTPSGQNHTQSATPKVFQTPLPAKTAISVQPTLNLVKYRNNGLEISYPPGFSPGVDCGNSSLGFGLQDTTFRSPEISYKCISFKNRTAPSEAMGIEKILVSRSGSNREHVEDIIQNQVMYPGISRISSDGQVAERKVETIAGRNAEVVTIWKHTAGYQQYSQIDYSFLNTTSGKTAELYHLYFLVSDDIPWMLSTDEFGAIQKTLHFSN